MSTNKRTGSIKNELSLKAKEAMLSAVQIFNNPNIQFKAETFVVLSIIAWTYLMHAYYRKMKIDYCYYSTPNGKRKKYIKTTHGAKKHWELERCLNNSVCPLDKEVIENLKFLIGLRHEIEHQMTTRIDDFLSARFQACCLNFEEAITKLIGNKYSISKNLSFALQFSSISEPQVEQLKDCNSLPNNLVSYITKFDDALDESIYKDKRFAYRVLFVCKLVNHKGQADRVVEFVKENSAIGQEINKQYVAIKEGEKPKYLPKTIVEDLKNKGYPKLNMSQFVACWKQYNAKGDPKYGCMVAGDKWNWYESFIPLVEDYCKEHDL